MAARKNLMHSEETKERISTSQLINRLNANALGEIEPPLGRNTIRSIEILLRKTLPDLKAVENTGQVDLDMTLRWEK